MLFLFVVKSRAVSHYMCVACGRWLGMFEGDKDPSFSGALEKCGLWEVADQVGLLNYEN